MCGIVGLLSLNKVGFTTPQITAFEQMLYADQLRGHHGTGMFFDHRDGKVDYIRGAMNANAFLADKSVQNALSKVYQGSSFVVGHNRWATKGAHINENTHPFREGNITLVHNGTLYSHRKLKNVEVDSHAVCHAFAEQGAEETLKEVDGAFAFVWYNEDEKKLHFIRNSQRPLFMIETKEVIALASEAKLAEWVLDRNKETVISVKTCEVGVMYSYDRESRQLTSETMQLRVYKKPEYDDNYYKGANSTGCWRGQTWVPYSRSRENMNDIDKRISDILKPENPKYLPSTVNNTTNNVVTMPSYRLGDKLDFTPLSVDPKGNGYLLTLIVQGALSTPSTYATYYHQDKVWMNTLMLFHTVRAEVIQIVQKHGKFSLIVKEPATIGPKEEDYEDAENDPPFDNSEIPTMTGVVH